ncbi:hypothetical protein H4R18_004370 [Coemansia javaensis]|uniref:Uncharacterized protein n=1 Tax=Coemansia javaensis TaxID=2761396 RepID=A0A9W8H5V5_9FUNG|nr:hypothetical protein H4R18_004370 [Coemansia javaensis]
MGPTQTADGAADNPFGPLLQTPGAASAAAAAAALGAGSLYSPPAFGALLAANALSVLCSATCIALIACLRYGHGHGRRRGWHQQPVSIRLLLYASVIDICYTLFRLFDMVVSQRDTRPDSQRNCKAAMFGVTFFALMSVFVRALFSVHLHAVIVHRANRPLSYEKMFLAASLALALLLALLPLTRFAYAWVDYDPTLGSGHCSYFSLGSIPRSLRGVAISIDDARRAVIAGVLWCWATYFAWVALTTGYCVFVIATVVCHLWKERRRTVHLELQRSRRLSVAADTSPPRPHKHPDSPAPLDGPGPMLAIIRNDDGSEVWHMAKKILRRVAQFPATIVICHSLEVAWATATLTRIVPLIHSGMERGSSDLEQLYIGMQIMLAMQGILALLSLCLEPVVKTLVVQLIEDMAWDIVTYEPSALVQYRHDTL